MKWINDRETVEVAKDYGQGLVRVVEVSKRFVTVTEYQAGSPGEKSVVHTWDELLED